MGKLVCEICGGSLIMNADNVAECESCGMKYAKEKIAQMVKIDGAVEITKGEAEKERLLKNAETFIKLKKVEEAYKICKKITDDYPDDYRGWYLNFKSFAISTETEYPSASAVDSADNCLKTALALVENKKALDEESNAFWKEVLNQGNVKLSSLTHNQLENNHIVNTFLNEVHETLVKLVKQMNFSLNKEKLCETLAFVPYDCWDEHGEVLNSIEEFYCVEGFFDIIAYGKTIRKDFDGLTFFGKTKYKNKIVERRVYKRNVKTYNDLKNIVNLMNKSNI